MHPKQVYIIDHHIFTITRIGINMKYHPSPYQGKKISPSIHANKKGNKQGLQGISTVIFMGLLSIIIHATVWCHFSNF